MKSIGRNGLLLMLLSLALTWVSCSEDTLDIFALLCRGPFRDTIFSFSSCFLFSRWQASAR